MTTVIVPQYLPGEWVAVVTHGCVALLPAATPPATVRALWESMRSTDAPSLVDHLQVLTAGGLTSLPPFALLSIAAGRLHAVVRGAVEVDVTAGGRARVLTARHVATWTEEVVDDLEQVAVRAPGVAGPVADGALPLVSGTVFAGAVQVQLVEPVVVVEEGPGAEHAAEADAAAEAVADDAVAVAAVVEVTEAAREQDEPVRDEPAVEDDADEPAEDDLVVVAGVPGLASHDEPWSDTVPAPELAPLTSSGLLVPDEPEPEPLHELARILSERSTPFTSPAPVRRPGATATVTRALPVAAAPAGSAGTALTRQAGPAVPSPALAGDTPLEDTLLRPAHRLPADEPAAPASAPAHLFAANPVLADVLADHDGTTVLSLEVVALRNQLPDWAGHALPAPVVGPVVAPAAARLVLSTGDSVVLDRPVLIGRAPQVSRVASAQVPRLVTVPSPQQDISRTHAEVRMDGDDVVLTDLRSTNGVLVVRPHAAPQRLQPGEATVLQPGVLVDLGEGVTFTVERDA